MAEVKDKIKLKSYKEYLNSITKEEIISILDTYKIQYKKSSVMIIV